MKKIYFFIFAAIFFNIPVGYSALNQCDSVTITGFGTFRVSERAARSGVNPRNPEQKIQIPAMKLPAFKAGKSFKDAVR